MRLKLFVVSKLCSEILTETFICINDPHKTILDDLYNEIHKIYPGLQVEEYVLCWRYSKDTLYKILDYISYVIVLNVPYNKYIYLLLKDFEVPWFDNIYFLEKLDRIELKEKTERERDIYDVKIRRPGEESEEEDDSLDEVEPEIKRTDAGVVNFALRTTPETKYFTFDAQLRIELIRVLVKGTLLIKHLKI